MDTPQVPQVPPPGRPKRERPSIPPVAAAGMLPAAAPDPVEIPAHLRPVPGKVVDAPVALPAKRSVPRATLTKPQREVSPTEEAAFATIEAEMGGRQKFVSTLSAAQLPADIERVLGAIVDPGNDRLSLAKICAGHEVSLAKLLEVFQSALMARGRLQAKVQIAHRLPDVALSVMEDAVGGDRVCPECNGVEAGEGKDPCDRCRGKGIIRHVPDHETQKTALKIGGLLEHGSGVKVNVNQQTFAMGSGVDSGSYDKLITALDGQLYGRGRARLDPAGRGDTVTEGEVLGEE